MNTRNFPIIPPLSDDEGSPEKQSSTNNVNCATSNLFDTTKYNGTSATSIIHAKINHKNQVCLNIFEDQKSVV